MKRSLDVTPRERSSISMSLDHAVKSVELTPSVEQCGGAMRRSVWANAAPEIAARWAVVELAVAPLDIGLVP